MGYGNLRNFRMEKNMKLLTTLLLLLIFFPVSAGCTITHKYGPYCGKIIDAETKEPIEGAAVLVVFYTVEPGPAGSIRRYADALETVTDKNGEFRIPEHKITAFKFFQLWDSHGYFTIFKPEYGCYPMHKDVKPMFVPNGTLPVNQYVIIELPNVRNESKEERLRNAACLPSPKVPDEKYKELRQLLNVEYKSIGY